MKNQQGALVQVYMPNSAYVEALLIDTQASLTLETPGAAVQVQVTNLESDDTGLGPTSEKEVQSQSSVLTDPSSWWRRDSNA